MFKESLPFYLMGFVGKLRCWFRTSLVILLKQLLTSLEIPAPIRTLLKCKKYIFY